MVDLVELKRLAEAATPGPWGVTKGNESTAHSDYNGRPSYAPVWVDPAHICIGNNRHSWPDAEFIAAANPATVLHLLSEIERLSAANKVMAEALQHIAEYWNRSENDRAMNDALYHMIETAEAAIALQEQGK